MSNKFFAIWSSAPHHWPLFYTEKNRSKMTDEFCEAEIISDPAHFWTMAEDPMLGPFKVHQADEKEIFKWQLSNEVPRDRL